MASHLTKRGLLLWSSRRLTLLLRTGISLSCRTHVRGRWDAGLRRQTGGFNPTEHLFEFLQHTGHGSTTTFLALTIVNVRCLLLLLLLTSSKHISDLTLVRSWLWRPQFSESTYMS